MRGGLSRETWLRPLYLLNAALLVAHEIDSAFWREWELFGEPPGGGDGAFVLSHVPLVLVVVWGYGALRAGSRAGLWMSALLALAGLAAGVIHGTFLSLGRSEFRTPVSVGVIVAAVLVSLVQGWAVSRAWRR